MKNIFKCTTTVILTVLMMLCMVACGGSNSILGKKISLDEHVSVTVEGYDGYGTVSIESDLESINSLVDSKKVEEYVKGLSDDLLTAEMASSCSFSDLIEFDCREDNGTFSNGDVVTIVVEVSSWLSAYGETLENMQKGLGISIKNTMIEFDVEGLEEAKVLDVMGIIEDYIVYEGANGGAEATVTFPRDFVYEVDGFTLTRDWYVNTMNIMRDHETIETITFYCEYDGHLSEGQTYTITLNEDEIELGDTGYIIATTKKEVTVPDLGEYISSKDELTQEFKAALDTAIVEYIDKNNVTIQKYYWGKLKPTSTSDNLAEEEYKLFVLASYESWLLGTQYKLCETDYMIKSVDGTYDLKIVSGTRFGTSYDGENITDKYYNLEEISW